MKIVIKFSMFIFCLAANFGLSNTQSILLAQATQQSQSSLSQDLSEPVERVNKQALSGKIEAIDDQLPDSGYLKGNAQMGELDAAREDPDADDKELMIAWDRWRNRFLQAVLGSTTEMLNSDQTRSFKIDPYTHGMEPIYPVGTAAWFVCEVTKDRQIKRLRILNSSGYPEYDQVVLEAVQALQDSSILRFPAGSRRKAVLQGGAVERANQARQQYFHFGDTERYRVPAN